MQNMMQIQFRMAAPEGGIRVAGTAAAPEEVKPELATELTAEPAAAPETPEAEPGTPAEVEPAPEVEEDPAADRKQKHSISGRERETARPWHGNWQIGASQTTPAPSVCIGASRPKTKVPRHVSPCQGVDRWYSGWLRLVTNHFGHFSLRRGVSLRR
jgi:hypothetical protein